MNDEKQQSLRDSISATIAAEEEADTRPCPKPGAGSNCLGEEDAAIKSAPDRSAHRIGYADPSRANRCVQQGEPAGAYVLRELRDLILQRASTNPRNMNGGWAQGPRGNRFSKGREKAEQTEAPDSGRRATGIGAGAPGQRSSRELKSEELALEGAFAADKPICIRAPLQERSENSPEQKLFFHNLRETVSNANITRSWRDLPVLTEAGNPSWTGPVLEAEVAARRAALGRHWAR